MRIGIFTASFTGNNQHMADLIEQKLRQTDQTLVIEHHSIQELSNQLIREQFPELPNYDAYVIGCWTGAFVPPPFLKNVVKKLDLANKYVLTFNCHGGDGGLVQAKLF